MPAKSIDSEAIRQPRSSSTDRTMNFHSDLLNTHSERRSTTLVYHQPPSGSPFPGSTVAPNAVQYRSRSEATQPNRMYHSQQDQQDSITIRQVHTPVLAISPVQDQVGWGYGKDSCTDNIRCEDQQVDRTLEDLTVKTYLPPYNLDDPIPTRLSPTARSTTIVSNTSSRGRTRTMNRLSYLAHLETIEAEDERDFAGGVTSSQAKSSTEPTDITPDGHHSTSRAPNGPQSCPVAVQHRSHIHRPSTANSCTTPAPPIPSLYKRLLRVFRPPTEFSSESDSGGYTEPSEPAQHATTRQPQRSRGVFGLPASPESSSRRSRSIQKLEEQAMASPSSSAATNAQLHRPPEILGFRARLLKRLTSSPNLSPMLHPVAIAPEAPASISLSTCSLCHQECPVGEPSPLSPLAPDFEHENTCPAGQRIQERRFQGRPRASTMPTLQSKYGTPGRELGAGTQAQVMLLRVKSSKRIRGTNATAQRKDTNMDEPILGDHAHSEDLLSPHFRSGNFKTTTEDEVTPSQREAYRKRLLHRTSTGAFSTTENGGLIYAIKKFRPPKASETHRQYLKKVCAEFCISSSMDHENIIRTIDLVRDHPGQEPVETEEYAENLHKDDHRDCNCSKEHHHRVGAEISRHRPVLRKSAVFRPHRNQSADTLSSSKSSKRTLGEHNRPCDSSLSSQICQHGYQIQRSHQDHVDRAASIGPPSQTAAIAKKKKHQFEQELRQKEVQRLKQQRQREKQQAEQWRLDQFPEYCMVMEFAAGGDLFNLLTTSYPPISLQEKHCLWRQLVNGVQYMHSIGVAHRDLKPENILLDGTGRILKITDFGIANVFKSVGDPNPLPCHGIIGSEPYIAPEEFYQDEYDPRAVDVWACGIIFYVMYYSAMPWARADRKKDARFARFVNDIMVYRQVEPQRRHRYERRLLRNGRSPNSSPAPIGSSGVGSFGAEVPNTPHDISRRHLSNQHGEHACGNMRQLHNNIQSSGSASTQEGSSSECSNSSPTVYNTYAYNNHIGGHGFIDRIESPGCRRVLYGILEPDARKRLTIDQVVNDEWVARIRYCTDCVTKQEQQALVFGKDGTLAPHNYMHLPNGQMHHQHTIPKKSN